MPAHHLVIHANAADIDELAHVSNLVYVRWVLEVAMSHSIAVGWDHPEYRALGAVFVVKRHEIDYVSPILEGQEVELVTWVAAYRPASSERRTTIRRLADGQVAARAVSKWAFIDMATGRPRRIPDELLRAFGPAVADVPSSPA
jgi:acyl-CoA thioester hydrolase